MCDWFGSTVLGEARSEHSPRGSARCLVVLPALSLWVEQGRLLCTPRPLCKILSCTGRDKGSEGLGTEETSLPRTLVIRTCHCSVARLARTRSSGACRASQRQARQLRAASVRVVRAAAAAAGLPLAT